MMLRALKWVAGTVLALVALAAIAVELVSWNFLKPVIIDRVGQATGRGAAIAGDVSLSLLPRPRLSIEGLSLANPDWARHLRFIEIERLQIAPGLAGLLMGRVELAQVDIDAPVIHLIGRSEGPPNWILEGIGNNGSADAVGDSVIVGGLAVSNAVIRYRPAGAETAQVFEIPSMRLSDDGDSLSATASVSAGDHEIELEVDSDSFFIQPGTRESLQGEMRARAGDSRLNAEFSASQSFPIAQWTSRIEVDVRSVDRWAGLVPGLPNTDIGALMLSASLQRSGSVWTAERIEITAMESSLEGRISLNAGEHVPVVEGALESRSINVAALQAAMGSDESRIAIDSLPVLPPLAGTVELEIAQIAGMAVVFTDFSARLELADRRLAAEQLSFAVAGGKVEGAAEVTSAPDSLQAGLDLSAADIRFGDVASGLEAAGRMPEGMLQGRLKGRLAASLGPIDRASLEQAGSPTAMLASNLRLPHAEFSFEGNRFEDGAEDATRLSINADVSPESTVPSLSVSGVVASRPLDVNIAGDRLADFESGSAYALKARASSGGLALAVDTTLEAVLQPAEFSGHVSVHAENGRELERWTGRPVMALPAFDVTARLQRRGELWTAEPFRIEIAETDLQGQLRFSASERPRFDAELTTETLDLAGLSRLSRHASRQASLQAGTPSDGNAESSAARGVVDLSVLRSFNASLALSATEVALPGAPALRQFELAGTLVGGELNVDSLGFELAGGTVALQGSMDVNSLPASARVEARFSDLALGRMADTFTPLEERLGLLSGELQASVTQSLADDLRDDVIAPVIGRLKIEPSTLQFADAEAGTELRISAQTRGLEDGEQRFELDGRGTYDGEALSIRFRGDALLDARLPDRPYSVDLDARAVESRIELDGTLLRPLLLAGMDLDLSLKGPNPERLSRLLGVPLPELPPYELTGRLGLDKGQWSLSDFDGAVGDSDLRGRLTFDAAASPPRLTGRLRSDSLDIEDFGEIFGVEAGAGEQETVAASGEGQVGDEPRGRYVLPDGPFAGDAWRQVDADVRYRGASVRAGDVPLSEVVLDFRLKDGVGKFAPVGFGVGDGRLDFTLTLDANEDPPSGTLGVRVRAVDLRDALRDWDLAEDSVGVVAAEGKFWVRGRSVAALLGSADGGLVMLMAEGRLDALLVELAGLDAGQAFLAWVGDPDAVPINCAYVDLQSRQGTIGLDTFVIDTPDTIFTAGGVVDMSEERADVSILAHPRDASVLVGRTPLHVAGTFDEIGVGIHAGELGVRVGASAGLGAVAGPVAALLPLLDIGDNEGKGYCQGLASRTLDAIEGRESFQ